MTKKDYIAVAKILASHRNNIPTDHFNDLVADFCAMFKANNARFDDMRFHSACKNPGVVYSPDVKAASLDGRSNADLEPLVKAIKSSLRPRDIAGYLGMPVIIKGK